MIILDSLRWAIIIAFCNIQTNGNTAMLGKIICHSIVSTYVKIKEIRKFLEKSEVL